eukprot:scaffold8951_cov107-Skeletonema_dohrnii-CCMP3373.AAC.5
MTKVRLMMMIEQGECSTTIKNQDDRSSYLRLDICIAELLHFMSKSAARKSINKYTSICLSTATDPFHRSIKITG